MIITLTDPASKNTASIDSLGAQLISLKDGKGKEYIWQRDPAYWTGCSPLLFPAVGGCRGGRTQFEGVWHDMEKHGFCRKSQFSVADRTDSSAVFCLASNDHTRRSFPYEFLLSLTYHFEDGVLLMDYSVENRDSKTIYYCLGAHPGFNCPLENGESFEDYQLEFEKEENTFSMVYDMAAQQFDAESRGVHLDHTRILPLAYHLFDRDAVFFEQIASRKVSLVHRDTGRGVEVSYPGFETVAFWTPNEKQAPFLCVEPWNGSAIRSDEDDEFSHRHHVQVLAEGEKKDYHLEIRILG